MEHTNLFSILREVFAHGVERTTLSGSVMSDDSDKYPEHILFKRSSTH